MSVKQECMRTGGGGGGGVSVQRGGVFVRRGVSVQGGNYVQGDTLTPVGQTGACENITLPQT